MLSRRSSLYLFFALVGLSLFLVIGFDSNKQSKEAKENKEKREDKLTFFNKEREKNNQTARSSSLLVSLIKAKIMKRNEVKSFMEWN